ncbi:LamB/YcsF family protein [Vibrio profundum]|uniref:5-oxoprolinase subunit PxpA n=1 Tax=Vibrio profundum TaxID=2910247 RepID=UPI003D106E61
MKINCDMGESFGHWQLGCDEKIMPYLHMANIACGMHASDPVVMQQTVRLAKQNQVMIGAHPGYPDMQGFGRRFMAMESNDLIAFVLYQVGALQAICKSESTSLSYVKPHGALYNTMMKDDHVFQALLESLQRYGGELALVAMAVPDFAKYQAMAKKYGVTLWFEAFVDRRYDDTGRLMPRSVEGSCLESLNDVVAQARTLIEEGAVITFSGSKIAVKADTLCIHGDGPLALPIAQQLTEGRVNAVDICSQ